MSRREVAAELAAMHSRIDALQAEQDADEASVHAEPCS